MTINKETQENREQFYIIALITNTIFSIVNFIILLGLVIK